MQPRYTMRISDSPVLRQCERATCGTAMGAQRIEVENDCGLQRRVSYFPRRYSSKARDAGSGN